MPEVLTGTQPGITVGDIQRQMADLLGYRPDQSRFANASLDWINNTLLHIQLHDPLMRRTVVQGASFSLVANVAEYDVRADVGNGGFGWSNCKEVHRVRFSMDSSVGIEPVTLAQHRRREFMNAATGPTVSVVLLDQFRLLFVPTPDQAYDGFGDYSQDIPKITDAAAKVDWPRQWDVVLLEGVKWRGYQWHSPSDSTWKACLQVYEGMLSSLGQNEKDTPVRRARAVLTRRMRRATMGRSPNDRFPRY